MYVLGCVILGSPALALDITASAAVWFLICTRNVPITKRSSHSGNGNARTSSKAFLKNSFSS